MQFFIGEFPQPLCLTTVMELKSESVRFRHETLKVSHSAELSLPCTKAAEEPEMGEVGPVEKGDANWKHRPIINLELIALH